MFETILGIRPKERRTQLHFRDDGSFEFRKLEIEDTFLVEKNNEEILRGWKHFFRNQFPFAGYKSIKADQVTLSYDRDIILDPYGLIQGDKDSPDNRSVRVVTGATKDAKRTGVELWLADVGEARRLKMMASRAKATNYNKVILFLGSVLIMQLLIIGILAIK